MADRVMLFLDYQNVYKGPRKCFHGLGADHTAGQIDPLHLGELLVRQSPFDRVLTEVRVYRGRPALERDEKGYSRVRGRLPPGSGTLG